MENEFASRLGRRTRPAAPFGRFDPTVPVCILCFPGGTIRRRSPAAIGRRTDATIFFAFSVLNLIFGHSASQRDCSAGGCPNPFNSRPVPCHSWRQLFLPTGRRSLLTDTRGAVNWYVTTPNHASSCHISPAFRPENWISHVTGSGLPTSSIPRELCGAAVPMGVSACS